MVWWTGWPLERLIYLFLGAAYALVWIQVTLYHRRGGMHSPFMWGPVLTTPLLALAALLMGLFRGETLEIAFALLFAAGAVEGLVGALLHLRGVGSMVGGLTARNFMAGPPVVLPLIYMALGVAGLLVLYWPAIAGAS